MLACDAVWIEKSALARRQRRCCEWQMEVGGVTDELEKRGLSPNIAGPLTQWSAGAGRRDSWPSATDLRKHQAESRGVKLHHGMKVGSGGTAVDKGWRVVA